MDIQVDYAVMLTPMALLLGGLCLLFYLRLYGLALESIRRIRGDDWTHKDLGAFMESEEFKASIPETFRPLYRIRQAFDAVMILVVISTFFLAV